MIECLDISHGVSHSVAVAAHLTAATGASKGRINSSPCRTIHYSADYLTAPMPYIRDREALSSGVYRRGTTKFRVWQKSRGEAFRLKVNPHASH